LDEYYLRADTQVFLPHKFWSNLKTSEFACDTKNKAVVSIINVAIFM